MLPSVLPLPFLMNITHKDETSLELLKPCCYFKFSSSFIIHSVNPYMVNHPIGCRIHLFNITLNNVIITKYMHSIKNSVIQHRRHTCIL
jgi:hypothetical protein